MEKYVKVGVAAAIVAAVTIVGLISYTGNPKEESAEIKEMSLDEDTGKWKADISAEVEELWAVRLSV